MDNAKAAQTALLLYINRVNVYDERSATELSTPDHAQETRARLAEFQKQQITRNPTAVDPPDQCAVSAPCRIRVAGQIYVRGIPQTNFNSEFVMSSVDGRWLVSGSVGEDIPPELRPTP